MANKFRPHLNVDAEFRVELCVDSCDEEETVVVHVLPQHQVPDVHHRGAELGGLVVDVLHHYVYLKKDSVMRFVYTIICLKHDL